MSHSPTFKLFEQSQVVPVELTSLSCISQIRIFSPKILTLKQVRQSVYDSIQVIIKRYPGGLAPLDPIEDMGIEDENFHKLIRVCFLHILLMRVFAIIIFLWITRKLKFLKISFSPINFIILHNFHHYMSYMEKKLHFVPK